MQEIPRAKGRMWPSSCLEIRPMNWWGRLKIRMEESRTASSTEGFAIKFLGRAMLGRYLTFS